MSHRLQFTALLFVFLMAIVLLCACEKEAPRAMMQMPPAAVQIAPVTSTMFEDKSDYIGTMKSRESVTLQPHVDGHITQIFVSSGDSVKRGDKLMQIDSRLQSAQADAVEAQAATVQSDLATAKATLASLESALKGKESNVEYNKAQMLRYTNLKREGAVSTSDLDMWKNNYSAAQADRDATKQQIEAQKMTIQKFERTHLQVLASLKAQHEQLRYFEIRAPFDGIIGDVPIKVGDHVSNTTQLATLTENHPLEVYVAVPAEQAGAIKKGQSVNLLSSDGKLYGKSTVIYIAPLVDSNSQTVLVKALFPNSESQLRAEQTVHAQVTWKQTAGISVPTKAVKQAAGKFYVFLAQGGGSSKEMAAHQAEIEVAGIEDNRYRVKNGLKPGDQLVLTGIQRLSEGAPIVAKNDSSENAGSGAKTASKTTN